MSKYACNSPRFGGRRIGREWNCVNNGKKLRHIDKHAQIEMGFI